MRHLDPVLLLMLFGLLLVSTLAVFSASGQSVARLANHGLNMLTALGAMWLAANTPPHILMRLALPLYALGLALLLGVAAFGDIVNGARRWLDLGVARIQPSELMKLAVPMMLAWYFDRYEATLRLRDFAIAAALLFVPLALVVRQPDLGTALLIGASGYFVLFFAGLSWRVQAAIGALFGASLPLAWSMLHDYQRQRVLTLLDPAQDPLGAGYHIIQSTIAVGSGGAFGKGWLSGTQAHLDFLPERTTDFIFAAFAEEFGLFGNLLLLLLYLAIVWRGLAIAADAPTLFSRLLAGSVTLTFFTYAFVNMGMVSGILPVVGVPLPLVSYGGTAMVTVLVGFGILMSVATHKQLVKS
jgi:rod shape determining protein RodA